MIGGNLITRFYIYPLILLKPFFIFHGGHQRDWVTTRTGQPDMNYYGGRLSTQYEIGSRGDRVMKRWFHQGVGSTSDWSNTRSGQQVYGGHLSTHQIIRRSGQI